jgi:hypothetical protein
MINVLNFNSISKEKIQKAKDYGYIVNVSSDDVMTLEKDSDVYTWYPNGSLKHYCRYYDISVDLDVFPPEVYLYGEKR